MKYPNNMQGIIFPIGETAMSEFEKLYTVGDIAQMTSFTTRTIRNYLKNGSLQGIKIGGQWRFTMGNIKRLFDNGKFKSDIMGKNKQEVIDFIEGVNPSIQGTTQVCTIVDCYCENQITGHQLYEKLVNAINCKDENSSPAKFKYDFIENKNTARFFLFGNPDFIIDTLQLL
jgi:hypothetical protein